MKVFDFTNANGLVNGKIPAGKPCPWFSECAAGSDNCPFTSYTKVCDFSCALARLYSAASKTDPFLRRGNAVYDLDELEFEENLKEMANTDLSLEQLQDLLKTATSKLEQQVASAKQLQMEYPATQESIGELTKNDNPTLVGMKNVPNGKEGICPRCGESLVYGDREFEGECLWYTVECPNKYCAWEGEEIYTINFAGQEE